jgi:two-component system chemotaxis response regulator CheY
MRIFLCDDNSQYRTLLRLVLEDAGHEIVGEAGDGQEAIDLAPGAGAEVLLLDLNMPRLSGWDALPRLREALPDTKIVILTTGQVVDEHRRVLDAGADGFIVKPPRISALDPALRAAVGA